MAFLVNFLVFDFAPSVATSLYNQLLLYKLRSSIYGMNGWTIEMYCRVNG